MVRLVVDRPLERGPFLAYGIILLAAKIVLDAAVAAAFGRSFSLVFYVDPFSVIAPRYAGHSYQVAPDHPQPEAAYWLMVVGVSLPFLLGGTALVIRRLRDAGLPPPLALIFFLPFLKFLFFAALAAVPSKVAGARTLGIDAGPFRSVDIDIAPPPPSERRVARRRRRLALLFGSLSGAAVGVVSMGFSVFALRDYGAPLMIAAPAVAGFVATWTYASIHRPSLRGTAMVTLLTFVLGMTALGLSALEGFACMLMGSPLFYLEAFLGGVLAHAIGNSLSTRGGSVTASGLAVLPLVFAAKAASPPPPEDSIAVESAVVVHAPPDVVWRRVIAFPPLAPAKEPIFRAGIAAPVSATIAGEGPGAVRRCEFTTGTFVEPIEVWAPGRELSFSVSSQPDPMREWTLFAGPRPRHLDGYLESTRGQFLLEPLTDGSTRLVGRTWYRVHIDPVGYWRVWGDWIIHAIHMRVLRHVAALAEGDSGGRSYSRQ